MSDEVSYLIPPGELLAISFVDIANQVATYRKTNKKFPDKIIDDAVLELTEMLRGETDSLDILCRILNATSQNLVKK